MTRKSKRRRWRSFALWILFRIVRSGICIPGIPSFVRRFLRRKGKEPPIYSEEHSSLSCHKPALLCVQVFKRRGGTSPARATRDSLFEAVIRIALLLNRGEVSPCDSRKDSYAVENP